MKFLEIENVDNMKYPTRKMFIQFHYKLQKNAVHLTTKKMKAKKKAESFYYISNYHEI